MEDNEDVVPDLEGESIQDFVAEEEQAANEEETMQAEINWAAIDPASEYLPLY